MEYIMPERVWLKGHRKPASNVALGAGPGLGSMVDS
jgi:hypothetical protein